ncbi:MAG TPA: hypothetical protein VKH81_15485 [Candidatus Angelobacter sp.]|nr:hypothetical protein [Candidatus Angelobacter sp.]
MKHNNEFLRVITRVLALAVATIFYPSGLCGQATDQKDKTKTEETGVNPTSVSIDVDSGRKTTDLPAPVDTTKNEGQPFGNFEVKQSAEFGGRISDFSGSPAMWDTLVNLGTGPRLLEYTLDMRSPDHTGKLFDDFSFSNFGYGGDPLNVSRLRFSKGAAYTFSASFHRDQNIFDYNLLANPLNPSTSNPNIPVLNSPHEFLLTRRMSDVNLGLFPVGRIRFQLGWSRVANEGTTFSTIHLGTESQLLQPTLNTTDSYRIGVSFRFIPRTAINYDQFFTHFKGDTTAGLAGTGFTLAGGLPVDLGLPFNTLAGQPCATPLLAGGLANPACNGALSYSRVGKLRSNYPTEQISFQSNYFKRLDMSGRFSYSGATADNPSFNEIFNGLITRSRQKATNMLGSSTAQRISNNGDFGITFRVTDRLNLIDTFRYDNFRIPTGWNYTTNSLFGATLLSPANVFSPATCPPPFTAATCPQHNASSGADVVVDVLNQFLKQFIAINTFEAEYQFTPRVSGYVGYRFERREITDNDSDLQIQTFFPGPTAALANRGACAGQPLAADGTCTTLVPDSGNDFVRINAQSALFGFSARPSSKLRFSFDTELYYADNAFTRISPRHLQWYKGKVLYKPTAWWNLGGAINIRENRNNSSDIGNLQHNRSYSINSALAPAEAKWGLDLSYVYNDIFSQTNICFVATPVPANSLSCGTPFLSGVSVYSEKSNIGSGSIYLKPIDRVTAAIGYTVTSSNGSTLILNPNAPTGPLSFNYHLPTGSLVIQMAKNLAFKGGWNYYDYNEKSDPGPTLPRDVRGNSFTLSLRYSM